MISAKEAKKKSEENLKEQIDSLTKSLLVRANSCIEVAIKQGKTSASFFVYDETGMFEAVGIAENKIKSYSYNVEVAKRQSTNQIEYVEYVFKIRWDEDEQDNS